VPDSDGCGCDCCNAADAESDASVPMKSLPGPSVPIHTSRRKFIQYTSALTRIASGLAASPAMAADNGAEAAVADDKKNIIAVSGPVAPFSTTRTYRNIVLSNGLKVVLVQDKMAQRSSVALSIDGAGQFAEPDEIPGLAHLMEHIVLSSTCRLGKSKVLDRRARRLWNNGDAKPGSRIGDSNLDAGEADFEDWLSEVDGAAMPSLRPDSFAFTSPDRTKSYPRDWRDFLCCSLSMKSRPRYRSRTLCRERSNGCRTTWTIQATHRGRFTS